MNTGFEPSPETSYTTSGKERCPTRCFYNGQRRSQIFTESSWNLMYTRNGHPKIVRSILFIFYLTETLRFKGDCTGMFGWQHNARERLLITQSHAAASEANKWASGQPGPITNVIDWLLAPSRAWRQIMELPVRGYTSHCRKRNHRKWSFLDESLVSVTELKSALQRRHEISKPRPACPLLEAPTALSCSMSLFKV